MKQSQGCQFKHKCRWFPHRKMFFEFINVTDTPRPDEKMDNESNELVDRIEAAENYLISTMP